MKTSLNNPFSGGLNAFNQASKNFDGIDLGGSITNLDQVNQARNMSGLMSQTNMYNLDEMLPKTASASMRLSKDNQAQYQNSMQQLAYDKLNTMKALTPFMNTGKWSGSGKTGTSKRRGQGQGARAGND